MGDLPAFIEVGAGRRRPDGANDGDLGMLRLHSLIDHLEALLEAGRDMVLIADAEVFELERLWMAGFGAFGSPWRSDRAVRPFPQVEHVLDVSGHLFHRQALLAHPARMIRVLTGDTGGQDGERLGADVLTELEVFKVTQADALMITPEIALSPALLAGADRILPAIEVVGSIAVRQAAAGEPHELGVQIGD